MATRLPLVQNAGEIQQLQAADVIVAAQLVGQTIFVDATNGNDSKGLRGRSDKPFLTISAAIAVAVSGDVIIVGPGTLTENSGIILPNNVSLIGQGVDVTIIQSSLNGGTSGHVILAVGNSSFVANLTVNGTSINGVSFGCLSNDTPFTNAIFSQVKGSSNGGGAATIGAVVRLDKACTMQIYDSILLGAGISCVELNTGASDVELWNCDISANGNKSGMGDPAIGILAVVGTVKLFNNKLTVIAGSTELSVIKTTGGTVEAHNIRIHSDNVGTTVYDLFNSSGTLKVDNVVRDDGHALLTSGVITYLWTSNLKTMFDVIMTSGDINNPEIMFDRDGSIMLHLPPI